MDAAPPAIASGQPEPERPLHDGVRSLFYYNTEVEPGQTVGLHLFEPRYRILIKRAWEEPSRNRELVFLPNFKDYIGASGDLGVIARVQRYTPIPSESGDPEELPRAEVQLEFGERVMVLFHWVEPETKGMHECTFRRIPELPSRPALEPLRDALHTSSVSRYHVRTQRGFLNIHSAPDDAHEVEDVVGRLEEAEQIVALEHRPGWVRHTRGWSVSRIRGDSWLWLIPEHPQVLAPGVDLIQSSTNTHYSHLVMHAPSAPAAQDACAAFEKVAPGSSLHVLEMRVPAVAQIVCVSAVLERLAKVYLRDAPPLVVAGLDEMSVADLRKKLSAAGMTDEYVNAEVAEAGSREIDGEKDEQEALLDMATAVDERWMRARAAAEMAGQMLQGTEVKVACGAPCGMSIQTVDFADDPRGAVTRMGTGRSLISLPPLLVEEAAAVALAPTGSEDYWGSRIWFEHFNRVELSSYIRSQYEYEQEVLQQCPYWDEEVPIDTVSGPTYKLDLRLRCTCVCIMYCV